MGTEHITSIEWLTMKLYRKLIGRSNYLRAYGESATTNRSNLTQYCQSNAQ